MEELENEVKRMLKIVRAEYDNTDGADGYWWQCRGEIRAYMHILKFLAKMKVRA